MTRLATKIAEQDGQTDPLHFDTPMSPDVFRPRVLFHFLDSSQDIRAISWCSTLAPSLSDTPLSIRRALPFALQRYVVALGPPGRNPGHTILALNGKRYCSLRMQRTAKFASFGAWGTDPFP